MKKMVRVDDEEIETTEDEEGEADGDWEGARLAWIGP